MTADFVGSQELGVLLRGLPERVVPGEFADFVFGAVGVCGREHGLRRLAAVYWDLLRSP
jgi:hypothetical protein